MKFIVSSSTLQKHLQSISGVLNSSNTLPILDYFLFNIQGKQLVVSGSDLETTMTTQIDLEMAEADASIAMPAKFLLEILKTFPDQPLTFTVNPENFAIEIASENGKYKLSGLSGEEFPKTPKIDNASKMQIDSGAMFNAINKTIFATGNDDLRPVMSGVFFELGSDALTFVATDAHKLVRYRRRDAKSASNASFIMPKKPLNLLKNTCGNIASTVEIEYNETNAYFKLEHIQLICRLIDGKYPNYEAVIPKENPNRMVVSRKLFLDSVRRVSIFSNKTTHQVRIKITGSELNISAEDIDFSNEAAERLTCDYSGEDMEIGFNSRFLLEMLNNLDSDRVVLELSAPNRAGLLFPETSDEEEEILMLVMPVMINN